MKIAVIPARGGSKRIPGKNIRPLLGRPLVGHTILAAQNSGVFDRVVVSTDSEEIADIAREYGEDVPLMRDPKLADDITLSSLVTIHVLDQLDPDGSKITQAAQLLPTCPLRDADDVRNSFESFDSREADFQLSMVRFSFPNPWWGSRVEEDGRMTPMYPEALQKNSQDLEPLFCQVGAIWWARPDALRKWKSFYAPDSGYTGWEIDWQNAIDIDNEEDWDLAEFFLQRRQQKVS